MYRLIEQARGRDAVDPAFPQGCAWIEGRFVPIGEARIPLLDEVSCAATAPTTPCTPGAVAASGCRTISTGSCGTSAGCG